ncbi:MAG: hypothetical protein DHS20C08_21170 [Rhodomicrobium sp.]|nr:MAG: hypothetical protein DHS20C08_21170 [Rhodomicrobium sp.]
MLFVALHGARLAGSRLVVRLLRGHQAGSGLLTAILKGAARFLEPFIGALLRLFGALSLLPV